MSYIIYEQKQDIAQAMLAKLVLLSHSKQEKVHIALSGGSTPKDVFTLIKTQNQNVEINWQKLHFWWCDERCVDFTDEESNFGEAYRLLFQSVNIPRENLYPMQGATPSKQAALDYIRQLKKHIPQINGIPQFDWMWLGMGDDGHTASLFVNGVSLFSEQWVEVAVHPTTKQSRITLTLKVINNTKWIDFLVVGESKAKMLATVLDREAAAIEYPVRAVFPDKGRMVWHVEKNAASQLKKE